MTVTSHKSQHTSLWQALNIDIDVMSVAESDESYRAFILANHSDGGGIKHMFKSIEDQMSGSDLGVLGTPCNPFSKYRRDRFRPGSVESHAQMPLTMEKALEWLLLFQPATAVLEQVEGFLAPLSCDEDGTPFDRQAIGAGLISDLWLVYEFMIIRQGVFPSVPMTADC